MPQSARGAPAKSLLPSRSCQIDEVVVGQAAAAVATCAKPPSAQRRPAISPSNSHDAPMSNAEVQRAYLGH